MTGVDLPLWESPYGMRFIKDNTVRIQRTPVSTLDKIDRHILDLLQRDGRMSMTELADAVGLTVTPCIERVRRLERDGVIPGYTARVTPGGLYGGLLVSIGR